MEITASSQDYLEAILALSADGGPIRSVDIAKMMGVSRASVNKAMGVLKEAGLIVKEKYAAVMLTQRGEEAARSVQRRHTVLKRFLHEVLGVAESVASRDACRMEHVISAETLEKLDAFLAEALDAEMP
ncbi:metal-dependent transcriptional regulator [Candidatus Soleaferrea massiliensis]|uniref:metal-dependent transcriptional regulator n=1 Tax=Candidatus Soleaferrea massiliensis TaxID=1470354 RepID=UPI00058C92B9|nr:metal-dependent transcriptional regulator [Candidatus Soleaferrea massiliensis]